MFCASYQYCEDEERSFVKGGLIASDLTSSESFIVNVDNPSDPPPIFSGTKYGSLDFFSAISFILIPVKLEIAETALRNHIILLHY